MAVAAVNMQRRHVGRYCAEADQVMLDMTYTAGYSAEFGAEGSDGVYCKPDRQLLGKPPY